MNLDMKRPCANCPFRKVGAIPLHPGRLESIVRDLLRDDGRNFLCHKTLDRSRENASACMGAIAYMRKAGRPSVAVRFALHYRMLDMAQLEALAGEILEPGADCMPIYPSPTPEIPQ